MEGTQSTLESATDFGQQRSPKYVNATLIFPC